MRVSMRATNDDNSSLAEASALHHALLNQCRKSATPSSFATTRAKCRGSASANAVSTEWASQSRLNALFNASGLIERALQNQYTCCVRECRKRTLGDLGDVWAVTLGFDDDAGVRWFYVQGFVRDDGTLATGGGRLEPKFFLTDGRVGYHRDDALTLLERAS
jgi:hypothetical protein